MEDIEKKILMSKIERMRKDINILRICIVLLSLEKIIKAIIKIIE